MSVIDHAFGLVDFTEQSIGNLGNARSCFKGEKDALVKMPKYEIAPQNVMRLVWYYPHTPSLISWEFPELVF